MNLKSRFEQGMVLVDVPLFKIGSTEVSVATVLLVVAILIATLWISRITRRAVGRFFRARGTTDEGTIGVASRLAHYAVLFVGLGIGLNTLGIDLTALFAAGALFAVAIGFAMQNLTANFVSGVILLLERAIKPGDVLEVEGRMVKVREMGIRATIARTLDEEEIVIPNSLLVQSTVINYTLRDRLYRLRALVGVVYSSDMQQVRQVLEKASGDLKWRHEQKPQVQLTQFADSSVNFEVSVWIDEPWHRRRRLSQLNETIWWALKEAGIVIAFPQLDVHFDPPVVESLGGLKRAV